MAASLKTVVMHRGNKIRMFFIYFFVFSKCIFNSALSKCVHVFQCVCVCVCPKWFGALGVDDSSFVWHVLNNSKYYRHQSVYIYILALE